MSHRIYRAPRWLPGPHTQTLVPALLSRASAPPMRRERWHTPDGDYIDVDLTARPVPSDRPWLILFHGLEGSSNSHYARALMSAAQAAGWQGAVPHFRGCSGTLNLAPRAYHSGDSDEIDWIVRRFSVRAGDAPLLVAGVSLGANALLKWLGERERDAARLVHAAAGISAPQELEAGAIALSRGFNRIYTANFLRTLKRKSAAKLAQHPGLFDVERLHSARDFHDFDDAVTAPMHGFSGCVDYWTRSSCKPWLRSIQVPTLVLNACNDPFLPAQHLATSREVSSSVELDYPRQGGHVGFPAGPFPGRDDWLSGRIMGYFAQQLDAAAADRPGFGSNDG